MPDAGQTVLINKLLDKYIYNPTLDIRESSFKTDFTNRLPYHGISQHCFCECNDIAYLSSG